MSAMQITLDSLLLCCLFFGTLAAPSINRVLEEPDPELTAGYFEGDMVIDFKRNGELSETRHWPNATVYYKIDEGFDAPHAAYIEVAMNLIESVSCIRFVPAAADTLDYIFVSFLKDGCNSEVGYRGGKQIVNLMIHDLESGCFGLGTIQHELLHTLGFFHQQNSPNRDEYIKIFEENIIENKTNNFDKNYGWNDFGERYDYGSILHYGPMAFSKNEKPTIVALYPEGQAVMGQRKKLSSIDIIRLNKMYKCPM